MNWICDQTTGHSRLMVGIDRQGVTIREWSDDCATDGPYHFDEGFFSWERFRKRDRSYSGDNGTGKLRERIIAGAISLMSYWGPSSDSCGDVPSLRHYLNGAHLFTC